MTNGTENLPSHVLCHSWWLCVWIDNEVGSSIEDLLLDEKLMFSGKVPELNSISHPVPRTSSFRSMQFRDINALWLYLQNAINVLHPENLGTLHNNPFDVVVCTTQNFQRRKPLFPCCWGSTRTQLFTTLLPLPRPHDFYCIPNKLHNSSERREEKLLFNSLPPWLFIRLTAEKRRLIIIILISLSH